MDNTFLREYLKEINIEELLSKSDGLNESQKEFFRAIAKSVIERQDDFFGHIESEVIKQKDGNSSVTSIITFLKINGKDYDGFNPIIDSNEDNNIIFINCSYDKVSEYETTEDGKKFKLEKTDVFVKKEKIISTLFRLYNIHHPYIYSPYSRRAFKLFELNKATNEYEPVDLKINNYDLSKITGAVQGTLMWNITVEPGNRLRSKKTLVNNREFDRYDCDKDSFIIPESEVDETSVDDIRLIKVSDAYVDVESGSDIEFMKVSLHEINNFQPVCMYSNKLNSDNLLIPKNLFTKSDIKLAVDTYYSCPGEYVDFTFSNKKEAVKAYSRDFNYNYNDLSNISRRNKNFCYLCFKDSGVDNFFIDRVNYFIEFMRYNYPNFYWVGVKA